MTITQHVTDLCLNEIERRGELTFLHGAPVVPYHGGNHPYPRSNLSQFECCANLPDAGWLRPLSSHLPVTRSAFLVLIQIARFAE